jgi:protein TonB
VYRGDANLSFAAKYGRYMVVAMVAALALHTAGALYSPPYAPTPYQLRERRTTVVDIPEEFEIPEAPEEITRPQIPTEIEASDDVSEEETIAPTEFDPLDPPDIDRNEGTGDIFFAFDTPPKAVRKVEPEYPELASKAEAEGRVWLRVTISETGRVIDATVHRSEVIPSLEQAAIEAAMKWLFQPAKQRDRPVKVQILLHFNFALS